jgi:hypothetical protein
LSVDLTVGTKFDQGKLRWDLVPPEFEEVVKVLTYGATKYSDRNWELGMAYGRLIAASLRHLWSWIKGERTDPETGIHHLAHCCCDVLFLLTYELRGLHSQFDDRAKIQRRGVEATVLPSSGDGLQPDLFAATPQATGRQLVGGNLSS